MHPGTPLELGPPASCSQSSLILLVTEGNPATPMHFQKYRWAPGQSSSASDLASGQRALERHLFVKMKKVNVPVILFFSLAAINLAKLKLFRHYYVLVSKKKNPKSVNKISSRSRASGLPKNWREHKTCYLELCRFHFIKPNCVSR